MPQKTVISKVLEQGEVSGIRLFFPQNMVLYADQFTGYTPDTAEELAVFAPSTMADVFEHYKPRIESIFLANEDGEANYEDFCFNEIGDFEDEKLIANSEILRNSVYKRDTYYSIIRNLERNRELRRLIVDKEGREALKNVLMAIKSELQKDK